MAEIFDGFNYVGIREVADNSTTYTKTGLFTTIDLPDATVKMPPRKLSKLIYYWRVLKWMWRHREEPNNRAKWRRMAREIDV